MRKKGCVNTLNSVEMYRLTRCVESVTSPFDGWQQAMQIMSDEMDRNITKSNIETAAKNCGRDINEVVTPKENNPFANMMAIVSDLRSRVEKLENDLGVKR